MPTAEGLPSGAFSYSAHPAGTATPAPGSWMPPGFEVSANVASVRSSTRVPASMRRRVKVVVATEVPRRIVPLVVGATGRKATGVGVAMPWQYAVHGIVEVP